MAPAVSLPLLRAERTTDAIWDSRYGGHVHPGGIGRRRGGPCGAGVQISRRRLAALQPSCFWPARKLRAIVVACVADPGRARPLGSPRQPPRVGSRTLSPRRGVRRPHQIGGPASAHHSRADTVFLVVSDGRRLFVVLRLHLVWFRAVVDGGFRNQQLRETKPDVAEERRID